MAPGLYSRGSVVVAQELSCSGALWDPPRPGMELAGRDSLPLSHLRHILDSRFSHVYLVREAKIKRPGRPAIKSSRAFDEHLNFAGTVSSPQNDWLLAQWYLTLCNSMDCSPPGSSSSHR